MATNKPTPKRKLYVFSKNCTNDHGYFKKGDEARNAFSDNLIAEYIEAGILKQLADNGKEQDIAASKTEES